MRLDKRRRTYMSVLVRSPWKAEEEVVASMTQMLAACFRLASKAGSGQRVRESLRSEGSDYCAISEGVSAEIDYPGTCCD